MPKVANINLIEFNFFAIMAFVEINVNKGVIMQKNQFICRIGR